MLKRNRSFRIRLVAHANNRRTFRRSARRRMGQGMPLTHQAERANGESHPFGNASPRENNPLAAFAVSLYVAVAT